jgi:hypothetical protein
VRFDLSTHLQKYLFESGFYDQLLEDASVSDITALAKKFLNLYFKDEMLADHLQLPVPVIKIRNNVASGWLGRCIYRRGSDNTTIEIQKNIVDSEKTLNRVLIHELVHHFVFLTGGKEGSNHGGDWRNKADELNKILGANYVTQFSDEADEIKRKEYYIVIVPKAGTQSYSFISTVSPSMSQKATILEMLKINGRVFKINDDYFAGVTRLSSTSNDKANARLKEIYDTGKEVKLPGLDKGGVADIINVKVQITRKDRPTEIVTADYIRRSIKARSGTVDEWIAKYNDRYGIIGYTASKV